MVVEARYRFVPGNSANLREPFLGWFVKVTFLKKGLYIIRDLQPTLGDEKFGHHDFNHSPGDCIFQDFLPSKELPERRWNLLKVPELPVTSHPKCWESPPNFCIFCPSG